MMSDIKRCVLAAIGVATASGTIVVGFRVRQHADLGIVNGASGATSITRMFASRTNDVNVPASDYFYELSQKLKAEYVEPVTDDQLLASGAIRGMVASLNDTDSVYMDKDQFKAFLNARVGKFEGIGADLELVTGTKSRSAQANPQATEGGMTAEDALAIVQEIPKVEVVSIVPGGPADKAGVKVGDTVESVDGHWVVHSDLIRKFRAAVKQYQDKKLPAAKLNVLRNEMRTKFAHAIFPIKAKDRLFMGKSGVVSVVWNRNGATRETKIARAQTTLPGFTVQGDTIRLPFLEGSAKALKSAIRGKSEVTLDLRNNTFGDVNEMKQCLNVLAPKGEYGYFVTKRHDKPTPLTVAEGNPHPPSITLLVDQSTRGMAEAFAVALSSKSLANAKDINMGGDMASRQIISLPGGPGYTLVTSIYQPKIVKSAVARKGGAR